MYVYSVPQFYCSKCGAILYMEQFSTGLYGYFILAIHFPNYTNLPSCSGVGKRFLWNPEEYRERHG